MLEHWNSGLVDFYPPCGTKFLREFYFADWQFFCVLRELILRLEETGFSCWQLICAIF